VDSARNMPTPIFLVRTDIEDHHALLQVEFLGGYLLDPQPAEKTE
jgi:hypothetical protein